MSLDVQFLACERTRAGTRALLSNIWGVTYLSSHCTASAWRRRVRARAVRLALSKRIAIGWIAGGSDQ